MTFFKAVFVALLTVGIINVASVLVEISLQGKVYACSDKEDNPIEVQKQCERLTRGQWWAK
jgi:hypothetical protein